MSRRETNDYFGALKEEYTNPYNTGELQLVDTIYVKCIKRLLDIVISLAVVIVTLPVNLVVGIITFFDVGRPIIFSHERPGLGEKPFTIVKFRNMTNDMDEEGRLLPPDQRVTKFGRFVRKTSLDELLNFYSILKGDMSLIGPRPLLMSYLPRYDMRQHKRHAVKPGLECPMANYFPDGTSWDDRIENDVWYVEHISFKTDIMMLMRLFKLVFNANRSKVRSEKIDDEFRKPEVLADLVSTDGSSVAMAEVAATILDEEVTVEVSVGRERGTL